MLNMLTLSSEHIVGKITINVTRISSKSLAIRCDLRNGKASLAKIGPRQHPRPSRIRILQFIGGLRIRKFELRREGLFRRRFGKTPTGYRAQFQQGRHT